MNKAPDDNNYIIQTVEMPIKIPIEYTLKYPRIELIIGIIGCVFFLASWMFFTFVFIRDGEGWLLIFGFSVFWLPFISLGIFILLSSCLKQLFVNGNHYKYTNWCGKRVEFTILDIAYVKVKTDHVILISNQSQVLCRLGMTMSNINVLFATLNQADIEFRL